MVTQSFVALNGAMKITQLYKYFSFGFHDCINNKLVVFNTIDFVVGLTKFTKIFLYLVKSTLFYIILKELKS